MFNQYTCCGFDKILLPFLFDDFQRRALKTPFELIVPFPIQSLVLVMKMKNIVEDKELACYEQFLVFPQCILPFKILVLR